MKSLSLNNKIRFTPIKLSSIILFIFIVILVIYIGIKFITNTPNSITETFTNEDLVIPNPIGGLGNQMFFVANAYAYGKKHNKILKIERKKDYYSIGKPRPTYYDTIFYSIPLLPKLPSEITEVNETDIYKPDFIPGNILISGGYFQKTDLLTPYLSEFPKLFINPQYNEIIDDIISSNNINTKSDWLLHVRLPDDWTPSDSVNISLPDDFNNIKQFVSTINQDSKIIVFSNDIPKTKELLGIKNRELTDTKYIFMEYSDVETLYVMSRMSNFIPSPSTFTIWGVMLSIGLGNDVRIKLVWNPNANSYLTDFYKQYLEFKDKIIN